MRRLWLLPACLVLGACGSEAVSSGDEGEDEFADGRTLVQTIEPQFRPPRIDMILVVDDSASMRPFQTYLQQNLGFSAAVLERENYLADIRIALTTTSVPGPACPGPQARGGEPLLDSCRAHLEDFVGPDEHGELGGGLEDLAALCEDACSLAEIPRVLSPGRDEHDLSSLALRPWIEAPHNPFGGNLDGVELAEALTCAGLRGFSGCAFESPLEAAARMVEHLVDPQHPMFEFRRPDAGLLIMTIGDEDDCSHSEASATIFDPAGERTFWSDPEAEQATSAVCINAGLGCDEQGCALRDHVLDGSPTDDPSAAVLTPTSRLHAALVAAGEFDEPPWEPVVTSVGGFTSNGSVHYTSPLAGASAEDQAYLDGFGVLPGCKAPAPEPGLVLRAGPGGRLAEADTPGAHFSICDPDWSQVVGIFGSQHPVGPLPTCIEFACVDDLDPSTDLLEPDCVLEELDWQGDRTLLPLCERDEAGWMLDPQTHNFVVPANAGACWVWQTDGSEQTSDPHDDLGDACLDAGHASELKIARRSYLPYDSVYQLRCRPCAG
ncbi:MAG: hypothetical protein R6X02_11735 [Enhygromyxa sp.]